MIYIRRIQGNSMLPFFLDGDYIIALKSCSNTYRVGDVVLADHPHYQQIIKRIHAIDPQGYIWLKGDGAQSVSTEQMGPLQRSQLKAKILLHIKKPR